MKYFKLAKADLLEAMHPSTGILLKLDGGILGLLASF